ncbi:MAG: peptidase M15D vanX D-ala-D-ala dipeptidase [Chitinivibrionales bacterium]|nr:peptidase M15D vanX D-ala-D-ala dipeptidase [Chitinivibrionales bacterium]MBD3358744.1 peptidase M15D vanX D-ala-D-ala dipeptidase [Chitinivibrionales bacterium]
MEYCTFKKRLPRVANLFAATVLWGISICTPSARAAENDTTLESRLVRLGLVDAQALDSTIEVALKYADTTNFMKENVYGGLTKCFLQPEAANKLVKASEYLRARRPDLRLLVVDGVRPQRVQRVMWDIVQGTSMQRYVANPRWGSMHNYGCAVDVTLVDSCGKRLDMGTPMDYFGALAQPRLEKRFMEAGKLTAKEVSNRRLLRSVMQEAGFHSLPIEWWHFNAFEKDYIRKHYAIIE